MKVLMSSFQICCQICNTFIRTRVIGDQKRDVFRTVELILNFECKLLHFSFIEVCHVIYQMKGFDELFSNMFSDL